VRLDLELAELLRRNDVSGVFSGNITLQGSQTNGALDGKLTVNQAEVRIPDRVGPDVPSLEVIEVHDREAGIPERPPGQPPYALNLDLQVDVPGRTFVRGRGLESEWQGKLGISGPATTPLVSGNLSVRRGYFYFLDTRFELRRGTIDFHGNAPPTPHISVEAEAEGHEMTGVVKLHGPADNPKLTLESEPPLPQDEILARLLFDRDLNEISALQALSLAAAARELALGGTSILGRARGSLGLDSLDFTGGGDGDGAVKAGKYIREDVFVEVESGIGEAGNKARVEWELTPNISVESSVDEESNSAFGLNWKFDY
jgi:translocation and assembly module TamB